MFHNGLGFGDARKWRLDNANRIDYLVKLTFVFAYQFLELIAPFPLFPS